MTSKELKNEIRQYCLNLILNSNTEDWNWITYRCIKDNVVLNINMIKGNIEGFIVSIYTDTTFTHVDYTVEFDDRVLWFCNKKEKEEIKKIRIKYRELHDYLKDKNECDKLKKTYNLLPIKKIRKDKLDKINENDEI